MKLIHCFSQTPAEDRFYGVFRALKNRQDHPGFFGVKPAQYMIRDIRRRVRTADADPDTGKVPGADGRNDRS
jgi:hypothetical protein